MFDINAIESFHFIRPLWLIMLLPVVFLHWKFKQIYHSSEAWKNAISEHLLNHLTVNGEKRGKLRPYQLLSVVLVLAVLATAGPSWRRVITPFTQDEAPLVIVLELSRSMLAVDQAPSRLERAKQKIRSLLEERPGARTAIVTYSGSAHTALPFTEDSELVEVYLESLWPSIMPRDGDRPDLAIQRAAALLAREVTRGSVLFLTDGIDQSFAPNFEQFSTDSDDQLLLLGFGTSAGGLMMDETNRITQTMAPGTNWDGLSAISAAADASLVRTSLDDADVNALQRMIRTSLVDALNRDDETQWLESGYYLTWLLMILALVWFRRGWTVA